VGDGLVDLRHEFWRQGIGLAGGRLGHEWEVVRQGYVSFKKNDAWGETALAKGPLSDKLKVKIINTMTQKEAKQATEKLESSKSHAAAAANEFKDAAGAKFQELRDSLNERAGQYREQANQVWSDTTVRARTLGEDSEEYIRENPLQAVGIAVALGFILGLILRR
jgi:ElaB/YqjD/DUF883 family membrane-anchored ribosome-binding protein